jgi:hypothetical protein
VTTCDFIVLWWDGDNDGEYRCELSAGHLDLHRAGAVYLDSDGEEVDPGQSPSLFDCPDQATTATARSLTPGGDDRG